MKFRFNVNVDDKDYLDYNKFWMLRSHYGKKQMTTLRITIAVFYIIFILFILYSGKFTLNSFISIIPMTILGVLFEVFLPQLNAFFLKGHLKSLKKKGKMAYSPFSVIEFYEDVFVVTTPENKTEQKYSSIERISIVSNKMIYLHINNLMAGILPFACFESKAQCDEFFEFIRTKCANIDIYK